MTRNRPLLWRALAVLFAVTLIAASCGDDEDDVEVTAPTETAAPDTDDAEPAETTTTAADDAIEDTQDGDLLDTILARGELHCGVSGSAVAFSETQPDGSQTGFDADYCRAVAAALFGDAGAVVFTPLTAAERFTAVQTGEVDVLMRNTTWTQSRDTEVGMDFGPTTYYDGQQLMPRESAGFSGSSQVADIAGAVVCTNAGTTTEQNIADAAEAAGISMQLTTFEDSRPGHRELHQRRLRRHHDRRLGPGRAQGQQPACRRELGDLPGHTDLQGAARPDLRAEPVPLRRCGELDRVRHDQSPMRKGITSGNVADMAASPPDAEAARLLGAADDEQQSNMGLAPDAFFQVIAQVGNYDEIYSRHLNPVGLTREGARPTPAGSTEA